jgi:hypothetical protein
MARRAIWGLFRFSKSGKFEKIRMPPWKHINRPLGRLNGLMWQTRNHFDLIERGRDGNRRVRTAMVELAWLWLRWQPESTLSIWFRERVGKAGGRIKKIMIVALAPVRARRTHKE